MSVRWVMFFAFVYILCQMVCLIIEGQYIGEDELDYVNDLGGFNILESQGLLGIPVLSIAFFQALPTILMWDYSYLAGGYAIVRLLGLTLSVGVIWGLIQVFGPAVQGAVTSFFRLFTR